MTLEELLKLVPAENKEAVEAFFNGLTGKVKTLSDEIKTLEASTSSKDLQEKLDKAIRKRDLAKAQLTVVRDTLGLPSDKEVSKELLNEHLDDTKKGDEVKDAQIATLKDDIKALKEAIETAKAEKADVEKERDLVNEEAKFIKVFSENMPSFEASSSLARADVERHLRKNAVLEEGKIYYKSGDGYVRVDGERMTMETRLAELQGDDEYSYLFKTKASGGSGSGNKGDRNSGKSKFEQRKRAAGIA